MKYQFPRLNGLAVLMTSLLSAASLSAATLTFQTFAPTPGANDIYNFAGASHDGANVNNGSTYADGAGNDAFTYIAGDRTDQGQTFTTGSDPQGYRVNAVWLRHCGYTNNADLTWYRMDASAVMTVRITDPAQAGTTGFALDAENYTITGSEPNKLPAGAYYNSANGTGTWLRFGLANTNFTLSPNTTYGFDVTTISGLCFFETFGTSNNVYSGGTAYRGTTNGTPDITLNSLVGDRVFLVEMAGQTVPPTIVTQPLNQMVPQGASANFSAAVGGTLPFAYQWYFNTNTLLSGQTNSVLALVGVTTNLVGGYSVIVTNNGGSKTSSVARLSVILPSATTNFNFSAGGGSIFDVNGVGTGFSTRLTGTGGSIPANDPSLLLNTSSGVLDITSTTCDFNGQLAMDSAEAIGFNLSIIGFNGTQDFIVTGSFTNLPIGTYVNYDQVGIFAGGTCSNFVRGGLIFNSDFANLSSYGVATPTNNDFGIATAAAPPEEMVVTIARAAGVWSLNVNGLNVTPGTSLDFLNAWTDLTVGVFALDTSGTPNTTTVDSFRASLFTGPKLNVTASSGNLTFTWNVVGTGLESNTDLSNPTGWTAVPSASASPYVISIPTSGSKFYRIAR